MRKGTYFAWRLPRNWNCKCLIRRVLICRKILKRSLPGRVPKIGGVLLNCSTLQNLGRFCLGRHDSTSVLFQHACWLLSVCSCVKYERSTKSSREEASGNPVRTTKQLSSKRLQEYVLKHLVKTRALQRTTASMMSSCHWRNSDTTCKCKSQRNTQGRRHKVSAQLRSKQPLEQLWPIEPQTSSPCKGLGSSLKASEMR